MKFKLPDLVRFVPEYYKTVKHQQDKVNFLLLNIVVWALRFVKSFIFMRFLDFEELGIITVITTALGFIGMLQFGLLNGGYRIYAARKSKDEEKGVNNLIYSYLFMLFAVFLLLLASLQIVNYDFGYSYLLVYTSLILGMFTLSNNWIGNILSAQMRFKELNRLELVSSFISIIFLFVIPFWGLYGALLVTFSQPLIYGFYAFIKFKDVRPSEFRFDIKLTRWILSFGFIPFLSGIFVVLQAQIERWSVVYFLDISSLGKFYLPTFYITLFTLIPLAVSRLFFPKIILEYSNFDFVKVRLIVKKYFIFLILYSVISAVVTILFIEPIVSIVFPKHLFAIKYVWYIFPGILCSIFVLPFDALFNASVYLKPIFRGSLLSTVFIALSILAVGVTIGFDLSGLAIIKTASSFFLLVFFVMSYFMSRKIIWAGKKV